jgi:hypothetical protein
MTIPFPIPRYRGIAFEVDNKWKYKFRVTLLGDDDEFHEFVSKDLFKSKEEAIDALNIEIQRAIKVLHEEHPELKINPDNYIDMKTNKTRRWDKKDEH